MVKVGGGSKKIGKNKDRCVIYKQEHRREKNKIKKWRKMLKKLLDNNETAIELKNKIKELERRIV